MESVAVHLTETELAGVLEDPSVSNIWVRRIGGRIGARSTRGEGSIFWFDVELEKARALAAANAVAADKLPSPASNGVSVVAASIDARGAAQELAAVVGPPGGAFDGPYDRKYLLDSVNGDAQTVREIVVLYVSESPQLLSRLGQSIELQNAEGILSAAHRLKGAMLAIGAGAASMAADLEELAQVGKLDACRERFAALKVKAKALDEALIAGELGGVPPPTS